MRNTLSLMWEDDRNILGRGVSSGLIPWKGRVCYEETLINDVR